MLSKLTIAYLILSTAAPIAGFLTDYALAIVATTVTLNWIIVPRIARCAKRMGYKIARDGTDAETRAVYVAELRRCRSARHDPV